MMRQPRRATRLLLATVFAIPLLGCHDLSDFATGSDRYEGAVIKASFVRTGFGEDVRLCLSLDVDHLQDAPGTLKTSDGLLGGAPLRPIPQLWHDPLSLLSFGEGRLKNLMYVARSSTGDLMAVVSLMASGNVEVRLLRGVSGPPAGSAGEPEPVFGVFPLERRQGPCSF